MAGDDAQQRWLRQAPALVVAVTAVALVGALAAVVAVDVLDVLGLRERLFVRRDSDYPYLFYHLFAEGRPIEWLQWLLLALAAVAAGVSAGALHGQGRRGAWGVALLGLAFAVLLLEDAGNPRHIAAWTVEGVLGGTAGTLAELAVMGLVAGLAVAGLVAAWPAVRRWRAPRNLLVAGYAVYAVAALTSATSDLWYRRAGAWVIDGPLGDRLLAAPEAWEPRLRAWLFMDSVVEESLELVAAGLLAVAALALLRRTLQRAPPAARPPEAAERDPDPAARHRR